MKTTRANANGAQKDPTARSVADCKQACLNKDGCAGFDFDHAFNYCWLHTSATIRPLVYKEMTDNYKLTDSCNMIPGM